jgi:hypothetical protein
MEVVQGEWKEEGGCCGIERVREREREREGVLATFDEERENCFVMKEEEGSRKTYS